MACSCRDTALRYGFKSNKALGFNACFIGPSTVPLVLYLAYSSPDHVITIIIILKYYYVSGHAFLYHCTNFPGLDSLYPITSSTYFIRYSQCSLPDSYLPHIEQLTKDRFTDKVGRASFKVLCLFDKSFDSG